MDAPGSDVYATACFEPEWGHFGWDVVQQLKKVSSLNKSNKTPRKCPGKPSRIALAILSSLAVSTVALAQPDSSQTPTSLELDLGDDRIIRLQQFEHSQADITIDGVVDDNVWQQVPAINEMRVIEPDTLASVPYATHTRMFYTERGLYVSFDMEQPADTLVRRISGRDNIDLNRYKGTDFSKVRVP